MTGHVDLAAITLEPGAHRRRADGVCLLELVAWWAHEPHSDTPACVSPVLRVFGTRLNDLLPAERRQALKAYVPSMVGTAGDGLDERRGYLAFDWVIRTYAPAWLRVAGLDAEAKALQHAAEIVDLDTARAAKPLVESVAAAAAAPWLSVAAAAAAESAAWAAAWASAWASSSSAALSAAWAAAAQGPQSSVIDLFARMIRAGEVA